MTDKRIIDLHVHSNASDGTMTPKELVKHAYESGLSAFALTDHDTIEGIREALDCNEYDIEIIPGIELSAGFRNGDIHILGLFIDYKSQKLLDISKNVIKERNERNQKLVNNLRNAGIPITLSEVYGNTGSDGVVTRAHFARFLVEHGYATDKNDAFNKYLDETKPYYVKREYLTPEQCIDIIHECGGKAILAHPLLYKLNHDELEALIVRLNNAGLDGIEAIYSTYSDEEESCVRSLAAKYNLLITGGSDFHGTNKPDIAIGKGRGNLHIPYAVLDNLKSALSK